MEYITTLITKQVNKNGAALFALWASEQSFSVIVVKILKQILKVVSLLFFIPHHSAVKICILSNTCNRNLYVVNMENNAFKTPKDIIVESSVIKNHFFQACCLNYMKDYESINESRNVISSLTLGLKNEIWSVINQQIFCKNPPSFLRVISSRVNKLLCGICYQPTWQNSVSRVHMVTAMQNQSLHCLVVLIKINISLFDSLIVSKLDKHYSSKQDETGQATEKKKIQAKL